jgi:hypothetical protein
LLVHEHLWISINYSITHFLARMSPKMVTPALSHCRPKTSKAEHRPATAPNAPPMATGIQLASNGKNNYSTFENGCMSHK